MSGKRYYTDELPPLPWWLVTVQLLVLSPVTIPIMISEGIKWAVKGRALALMLGETSDTIEAWWYRRQAKRLERSQP